MTTPSSERTQRSGSVHFTKVAQPSPRSKRSTDVRPGSEIQLDRYRQLLVAATRSIFLSAMLLDCVRAPLDSFYGQWKIDTLRENPVCSSVYVMTRCNLWIEDDDYRTSQIERDTKSEVYCLIFLCTRIVYEP